MKRKRKLLGVLLLIISILVLQLPMSEADAAGVTSDFSVDKDGVLQKYNGTASTVTVPSTVVTIATDAFKNNDHLVSVTIPDSVTRIEPYAFWDCDRLESVSIGKGLKEIGDFVFANCMGLRTMVLPENIKTIGIYAFQDDVNLTDITIPYQTANIHQTAFDGCYQLVIHAPEGSYPYNYAQDFYIRQKDFPEYEDLSDLIPDTTPNVPDKPEEEQSGESSGEKQEEAPSPTFHMTQRSDGTYTATVEGADEGTISSVHVVDNSAVFFMDNRKPTVFSGNAALEELGLGEEEPEEAGAEEEGNVPVKVRNLIPKYTVVDGQIVADHAFYQSGNVTELDLPETIREIGEFAYARSALQSAKIPAGTERIDYGAFYHCDDLTDVEIPDTVSKVEPNAFASTGWVREFFDRGPEGGDADFLVSGGVLAAYKGDSEAVVVPEAVRIIAAGVFEGHEEIASVSLPDSLTRIGEQAFYGCHGLKIVTFGKDLTAIEDRAFLQCPLAQVQLPASLKSLGIGAFEELTEVAFEGEQPAVTYETTAQRLSNKDLRIRTEGIVSGVDLSSLPASAGVALTGQTGIYAELSGADEGYVLTVIRKPSDEELAAALRRAQGFVGDYGFSEEGAQVYEVSMTDGTGIPITRLGKQVLTLAIPMEDGLKGSVPAVLTVDRNGQLELLPSETVRYEDRTYVRFETTHLSPFEICATSEALGEEQIITSDVILESLAAPPVGEGTDLTPKTFQERLRLWAAGIGAVRLLVAGALILCGFGMILWRGKKI